VHELKELYKLWHDAYTSIPKPFRYTLASTINNLLTAILQQTLDVGYSKREEKIPRLIRISTALDHLKLFVTLLWELKGIDNGKFSRLSQKLTSIRKMLGGWMKKLQQ